MAFNSITFLVFLAIVLAVHHLPLSWRTRKFNLLIASYLFYAAWNPPFVILVWISTTVDWFAAKGIARSPSQHGKRAFLTLSMSTNLGLLGFFKYGGFVLENFTALLSSIGIAYQPPAWDIVLPVGISFYTFQTMSYTIDVYRGRLRPSSSLLDFALYVTFFPQLVAGPIVRASYFLPQLPLPRRASSEEMSWGATLLAFGLLEKVVLADHFLAPTADLVYANVAQAGFTDAWIGTLAFAGQIFYDFAGYSMCAIGIGMLLGFAIPDNFRFPYAAIGFSDFWRRWHISLSTWLRDYLYIPLGGNRKGRRRTSVNLMATMLLGGLWHGAAWTFIVWGGIHGLYLMTERWIRARLRPAFWHHWRVTRFAVALVTFGLVCLTWVFFRAQGFDDAFTLLSTMLIGGEGTLILGMVRVLTVTVLTSALLTSHWLLRDTTIEDVARRVPWWLRTTLVAAVLVALIITPGSERAFIYFQF